MSNSADKNFATQSRLTKEQILESIQENKVNRTNIAGVGSDLGGILTDIRDLIRTANGRVNISLLVAAEGSAMLVAVPVGFNDVPIYGDFTNSEEYNVAYEKLNRLVEDIATIDSVFDGIV